DHIYAIFILVLGQLLTFRRVVPGSVGDPDIILHYLNFGINVTGALLIAGLELVNKWDIHPANKSDLATLALPRRNHTDQKRAFVLFEDQRGDIRQSNVGIDDG